MTRPALPVPTCLPSTERIGVIFGGGAAHQHLVGEIQVFARNVALDHLDTVFAGQRLQCVAGDAGEDRGAGRRGVQHAVEHQEQVLARAFAEQAAGGQRDAFAEAEAARFARDQLTGKIVATGLGAGRNGVRREALPARHAGVMPFSSASGPR